MPAGTVAFEMSASALMSGQLAPSTPPCKDKHRTLFRRLDSRTSDPKTSSRKCAKKACAANLLVSSDPKRMRAATPLDWNTTCVPEMPIPREPEVWAPPSEPRPDNVVPSILPAFDLDNFNWVWTEESPCLDGSWNSSGTDQSTLYRTVDSSESQTSMVMPPWIDLSSNDYLDGQGCSTPRDRIIVSVATPTAPHPGRMEILESWERLAMTHGGSSEWGDSEDDATRIATILEMVP